MRRGPAPEVSAWSEGLPTVRTRCPVHDDFEPDAGEDPRHELSAAEIPCTDLALVREPERLADHGFCREFLPFVDDEVRTRGLARRAAGDEVLAREFDVLALDLAESLVGPTHGILVVAPCVCPREHRPASRRRHHPSAAGNKTVVANLYKAEFAVERRKFALLPKTFDTPSDGTAAPRRYAADALRPGGSPRMSPPPKAVVLLSGGLDSTTALAMAQRDGYKTYALSFRYGQRHEWELEAARRIARKFNVVQHVIAQFDLRTFGGSALTSDAPVPKDRSLAAMSSGIPVTYVPARNTIFLSFALAWAEVLGASDIFVGMNSLDYSGYPDCRPEYLSAVERMADLATKAGVEGRQHLKIHAPLLRMSKAEIIQSGLALGVDYALTSSCYEPSLHGEPCGRCDSCLLRLDGFRALGLEDPLDYQGSTRAAV